MAEFLEGSVGETLARDVDVQMDRMESTISKQGYSDGFLAGKQTGIQEGFDDGFKRGARLGSIWGDVEGKLNAMLYLHSDKSSHFKLLLEEMKEKFNEQNHYFAQFGDDRQSIPTTALPDLTSLSRDDSCCGGSSSGCCKSTSEQASNTDIASGVMDHCEMGAQESASFITSDMMCEIDTVSNTASSVDNIRLFYQKIEHILSL